jgi:hypothetical protein
MRKLICPHLQHFDYFFSIICGRLVCKPYKDGQYQYTTSLKSVISITVLTIVTCFLFTLDLSILKADFNGLEASERGTSGRIDAIGA